MASIFPFKALLPALGKEFLVSANTHVDDLKRQIESQWLPATGYESSKVVLTFSISRSGTISNLAILTGSGRSHVDQAAIDAVQRAADSFGALPPGYSRNTLDIEFTFSITVEQPHVLY